MAIDWDDALAYSTVKLARVQDKRLGILHYSFTLAILGYIVVGVMYVDKDYLLKEAPQGTVRVGLLPPAPDYQAQVSGRHAAKSRPLANAAAPCCSTASAAANAPDVAPAGLQASFHA